MNSILFKPIGRRVYFVGLLVIMLLGSPIIFFAINDGSLSDLDSLRMKILPFTLLLGLVRIIWDYKRIKDISVNPYYLFLLIIPAMSLVTNVTKENLSQDSMLQSLSINEGISILMFFGFVNLFYQLFLIFKKGLINKTIISTSVPSIHTPSQS